MNLFRLYADLPLLAQSWVKVFLFYLTAWVLAWILGRMARGFLKYSRLAPGLTHTAPERQKTLRGLLQGIINVTLFTVATLLSLGQFIETTTMIWLIGLFGAGFGLSARPIISDVMAGASFIFEDTFAVGEKVEILGVEGVIESITLRTTWLRAPGGELYTIPNGDIRMLRNFSRGRFSTANITVRIHTADLSQAIGLLEQLGRDAMDSLPDLIEPWQVISPTGQISQDTELTLLAKARFGQAAGMRTRLLAMVHATLVDAGIDLSV